MQGVLVIVGVIGAGKTTLAKHIAEQGGEYIDFDYLWHRKFQKVKGTPIDCAAWLADNCSSFTVIDGWWTWTARWWETGKDETLAILPNVRLIHLQPTFDQAYAGYIKKWESGRYGKQRYLSDRNQYKDTLPMRMAYLSRKVREWAT